MDSRPEQTSNCSLPSSKPVQWKTFPTTANGESKSLSICIASPEFNGPNRNGGVGTFYTALGEALSEAGHKVTFLHTVPERITELPEKWKQRFDNRNIIFDTIDQECVKSVNSSRAVGHSYACYEYLKDKHFDIVHLPDWQGFGYHSLLAKGQGLTFLKTTFVIGAFGHEMWLRSGNREQTHDLDTIVFDFMERKSLELADVVVSHSAYMLNELMKRNVVLPANSYVQPNLLNDDDLSCEKRYAPGTKAKIEEIVFAGRLEEVKGLRLFCDAIDRLVDRQKLTSASKVTFLGKVRWIDGASAIDFIKTRSAKWPFEPLIMPKLNHEEALLYLGTAHRLAVVPSIQDNVPYVLASCVARGIPAIASDVGGVREIIVEGYQGSTVFRPTANDLADKLEVSLAEGAEIAALNYEPIQNKIDWVRWHNCLGIDRHINENQLPPPVVSICIPHYNSPVTLKQTIESIEQQDYSNFEVVLVDDGSPSQAAKDYLTELEGVFATRDWIIKRQENKYLGAARNEAARLARGDYLLFMDHDNIAKKSEVSTFIKAALNTNADILTCSYDIFSGDSPSQSTYLNTYVPLGAAVSAGLYKNFYGDANALVKKATFDRLGGFTEDVGIWGEDWEFFANAVLNGAHLETIPETLFWYREHPQSMHHSTSVGPGRHRALRPYLASVPVELQQALMLAITNIDLSVKPIPALPKSEYAKRENADSQQLVEEMKMQNLTDGQIESGSGVISKTIRLIKQTFK